MAMDSSIRRGKLNSILLICKTIVKKLESNDAGFTQEMTDENFKSIKTNLTEFIAIANKKNMAAMCSSSAIVDVTRTFMNARSNASNEVNHVNQQVIDMRFEELINTPYISFNNNIDLATLSSSELQDMSMIEYQDNVAQNIRRVRTQWAKARVV